MALHCSLAHAGAWSGLAERLTNLTLTGFDQIGHGRAPDWDGMTDLHDAATADALHGLVAKGAMPPLVLQVKDCRAAYEALSAKGVEFIQEPISRYGQVDAGFRDPSGNGWKMIERQRKETA